MADQIAKSAPDLKQVFSGLKRKSHRVNNYFPIYQRLFERYHGVPDFVFVEVGVMDGGSLVMWREFFGPSARIIGIDFKPAAEKMRGDGFEIFIGDQGSSKFWEKFYHEVGDVDVLVDDGGHTNRQQIVTVDSALDHIRDGGMIVVEDVVTSYLKQWGNPSRYSFMNYAKRVADKIQSRASFELKPNRFSRACYAVSFYAAMAIFDIDRRLCIDAVQVTAGTAEIGAVNFWNIEKRIISHARGASTRAFFRRIGLERHVSAIYSWVNGTWGWFCFILENKKLRKYF
jgi:hypothetical protein